jgi:hypothetical protein
MFRHRSPDPRLCCTPYTQSRRPSAARSRIRSRSESVWLRFRRWVSHRKSILPNTKWWLSNPKRRWPILSQSYSNAPALFFSQHCHLTSNNFCHTQGTNLQCDCSFDYSCSPTAVHRISSGTWTSHYFRRSGSDCDVILDTLIIHLLLSFFSR